MKIKSLTIIAIFSFTTAWSQSLLTIPQIQSNSSSSPYNGVVVKTTGVVTATFMGSNQLKGFFLQDPIGDNNSDTSDGIFVYTSSSSYGIQVGDGVEVVASVSEYNNRTQLSSVTSVKVLSNNQSVAATRVTFPDDFASFERFEGMVLEFAHPMIVVDNNTLERFGQLMLSSKRLMTPTEVTKPGSAEYTALVSSNSINQILLDDASTASYPKPIPFLDEDGTRRTGEQIDRLTAVLDHTTSGYLLYPASDVTFTGNGRPLVHPSIGEFNVKVCGFNLEYYLRENLGTGYGPNDINEANIQHNKILKALLNIDADIYGLVEIQSGQTSIKYLTDALNTALGKVEYSYIDDKSSTSGSYTKVGYIYRSSRIAPYRSIQENSTVVQNRKKAQGFTLIENGERFIYSINHFKAKSGCSSASGADRDQGDGQSCYNASRVTEANTISSYLTGSWGSYFGDSDVLIMGDLNAYALEDPITTLEKNGFANQLKRFDGGYSYNYSRNAGCLDHALANSSMAAQITGATTYNINSDELSMFEYNKATVQDNMYRCSDHDPVIVGLKLGTYNEVVNPSFNDKVVLYPNPTHDTFTITHTEKTQISISDLTGKLLFQTYVKNDTFEGSASGLNLRPGIYLVRVREVLPREPESTVKKLIIQ